MTLQLDSASCMMPAPQDSSRIYKNLILYRNPVQTPPAHYPSSGYYDLFNMETFQKFSPELLFTLFYRYDGTLIQKLAARALKQHSWRFHTDVKMWFQRRQEPKRMTEQFENGSYLYFDFERWTIREKNDFTFEYKYLEDKDNPQATASCAGVASAASTATQISSTASGSTH